MMKTSVFFIHGFTGGEDTWDDFPNLLRADGDLKDYDFHFWKYDTKLNLTYLVTKYFWTDDPDIRTIGESLRSIVAARAEKADRLMLIGHSMGGLAIQSFIIEELGRGSRKYLDRLTEVVLCGTPSAGLVTASWGSFLKNQIADMDAYGPFIEKLRAAWTLMVDGTRSDPKRLAKFRLTPIAGAKDKFVPQETSLTTFPHDENFVVPGDHVGMVKPKAVSDDIYAIIRQRLQSDTPTAAHLNFVAETEIRYMSRVKAARDFGNAQALVDLAGELTKLAIPLPLVQRELGLALLGVERYAESVDVLRRYLASPDQKARPVGDYVAVQQLAIALSGMGDDEGAVAELNTLPDEIRNDPETQGIMAGRFKRQWLKSNRDNLGWRAFELYKNGFVKAQNKNDGDQVVYNGINTAYMGFVLGDANYKTYATAVLPFCNKDNPDYWSLATKAEVELLLDLPTANATYAMAKRKASEKRHWTTTRQQALDIATRKQIARDLLPAVFED